MKITDLFNLEKMIKLKKLELELTKQELEKLRKEAEELKLMIEINNKQNSDDMVDISNVVVIDYCGKKYFAEEVYEKISITECWRYIDVFSDKEIFHKMEGTSISYYFNDNDEVSNDILWIKKIEHVYPEVNCYPEGKVPKLLLQKLYYEANNIDAKVLKRGVLQE